MAAVALAVDLALVLVALVFVRRTMRRFFSGFKLMSMTGMNVNTTPWTGVKMTTSRTATGADAVTEIGTD